MNNPNTSFDRHPGTPIPGTAPTPSRAPPGTPLEEMTKVQLNTHKHDMLVHQYNACQEASEDLMKGGNNSRRVFDDLRKLSADLRKLYAVRNKASDEILAMITERKEELEERRNLGLRIFQTKDEILDMIKEELEERRNLILQIQNSNYGLPVLSSTEDTDSP